VSLRSASAVAASIFFCAASASAQLLPTEEKPAREKKEKTEKKDEKEEQPFERIYTKPPPLELPEGDADPLSGPITVVTFQGIVNPGMGEYVITAIDRAPAEGAQAVLIELDTPGGLVTTTEKIVQAILGSRVPVIIWVTPSGSHAASAGALITLAGHVAAMSPATRIGAAHPVTGSGKDPESEGGEHMGRKVENDLASFAESIAKQRGRNVEWAIDAVRQSVSITETKALEIGVIDLVAQDREDLFQKLDGKELMVGKRKVSLQTKDAQVREFAPSLRQKLLNLLASPGIAMILGILGLIGIMIEIYHPGVIAPGVMGVLCLICSLMSLEQLPIDVGGAILVLGGIALLVAEIYTATYGALGILGGIGLTVGLLLLVDVSDPKFAIDPSFKLGLADVLPLVAILGLVVGYISFAVVGARRRRPMTGKEGLIGSVGFVLKPVDADHGMVFVQGEYWKARSSVPIPEKAEVEVIGIDGLLLDVRPASKADSRDSTQAKR
jgi:membrane-bound serine protease (ClpP class)